MRAIVENSEHVFSLTQDLSTYLAAEIPPELLRPIDLNKAIEKATTLIGNPELASIDCDSNLGTVFGDFSKVVLIVSNILSNGIKYNESNDKKIRIQKSAKSSNKELVIEIQDNGIGIDEDGLKDIFNPFCRLVSKKDYPGTSLGLAMVRRNMMQLNGDVWVESIVSKGSTFFLRFKRITSDL